MVESKKQIIILRHNGGRLGNQLILYASIYAFCLQMNYECINYSFYNYRKYFQIPPSGFFMNSFDFLGNLKFYKTHKSHLVIYYVYMILSYVYQYLNKGVLIKEDPGGISFLPPTPIKSKGNRKLVDKIIKSKDKIIYIDGWSFRNPTGIKKYRKQIKNLLQPKKEILKYIEDFLKPLKSFYLVGVHIRQGDYKIFRGGKLYFTGNEVAQILKKFLKIQYKGEKKVHFIICSDGSVNLKDFKPLNISLSRGSMVEDLFLLSRCNIIIGSESTFGAFASYYGNIPFKTFKR